MIIKELSINVTCKFKRYNYVVCDDNKDLWMLPNCPRRRTIPLRKLTYNSDRKGYRIYGQWVSKKLLHKLRIDVNEKIIIIKGRFY